jgi:cholesterol oxidase
MSDPQGIMFNEVMSGFVSLGVTDPGEGETQGKAGGMRLTMSVTVGISDLDLFLADPGHDGTLSGRVDFEPLGMGLDSTAGTFKLFTPTDVSGLKLMVYELAFAVDGAPYYLAGQKNVHNDPGFDMWRDTTTLFTTLYHGSDKSEPVAGAGILRLGMFDLVKLLRTLHVTGATTVGERARAVETFGRFFAGELWEEYFS